MGNKCTSRGSSSSMYIIECRYLPYTSVPRAFFAEVEKITDKRRIARGRRISEKGRILPGGLCNLAGILLLEPWGLLRH